MAARPADHRRATAERNAASTIAAVATRAGLSRVTVYAHFNTREAILEAVVERAVARATVAFDEATSGAASAM